MKKWQMQISVLFIQPLLSLTAVLAGQASASSITYSGSSGNLSASVTFTLTGNDLTVELSNTSPNDVLVPSDILTAVFFSARHTLAPVSASVNGSDVFYRSLSNAGDGWGYYGQLAGVAHGMDDEITSVGFGIGNGHSNFTSNHNSLGGVDFGLLSRGDDSTTGNAGVKGKGPLIKDSVEFTLTVSSGFHLDELGDTVVFQYGSALADPHFAGHPPSSPAPEPQTLVLLGFGILGLAGVLRRNFRQHSSRVS